MHLWMFEKTADWNFGYFCSMIQKIRLKCTAHNLDDCKFVICSFFTVHLSSKSTFSTFHSSAISHISLVFLSLCSKSPKVLSYDSLYKFSNLTWRMNLLHLSLSPHDYRINIDLFAGYSGQTPFVKYSCIGMMPKSIIWLGVNLWCPLAGKCLFENDPCL